jgi:hypothetical protein
MGPLGPELQKPLHKLRPDLPLGIWVQRMDPSCILEVC